MNILPFEKQVSIISALTEGCSIRTTERPTGVHRDTIMRLASAPTITLPPSGLYVAHFNFCRVHEALRITPATALGLTDHVWTIGELIGACLAKAPT